MMRCPQFMALIALGFSATSAAAASCSTSTTEYNLIFSNNKGCYPLNYYRTSDLGNTNPTDARSRCQAGCTSDSSCAAIAIQLNSSPNGMYSGTCFYYSSQNVPTQPRSCANTMDITAYKKDSTLACLSASPSAATAFCSSYLGIGVVTSTTSTHTPLASTTTTVTTTETVTSTAISTVPASTTSIVATSNVVITTTSYSSTSYVAYSSSAAARLKRAAAPTPACLTSGTPSSRLSSACSCLSIASSTVYTSAVASTSTKTVIVTTTATSTAATSQTTTSTSTILQTTTVTSTSTVSGQGVPVATCPANAPTVCSGKCTDTAFDVMNCGTCGNVCTSMYFQPGCDQGHCTTIS